MDGPSKWTCVGRCLTDGKYGRSIDTRGVAGAFAVASTMPGLLLRNLTKATRIWVSLE